MAGGWARDGAEHEQMEATVNDALERARRALPSGVSVAFCEDCEQPIPKKRREALIGVKHCVSCQNELEAGLKMQDLFNRRGSKDSQLR